MANSKVTGRKGNRSATPKLVHNVGLKKVPLTAQGTQLLVFGKKPHRGIKTTVVVSKSSELTGPSAKSRFRAGAAISELDVDDATGFNTKRAFAVVSLRRREKKITEAKPHSPIEPEFSSVREQVRALGIMPGTEMSGQEAKSAMRKVVSSAKDMFNNTEEVEIFLRTKNFDESGLTGEELIQQGRTGRVLSRLNELRFGPQG